MKIKLLVFAIGLIAVSSSCSEEQLINDNAVVGNLNNQNSSARLSEQYLFFRSQSSASLRCARSTDGLNWSNQIILPGKSEQSPTAIYFKNRFYVSYMGQFKPQLFLSSSSDAITWSEIEFNLSFLPSATGMCAYNGELYIFMNVANPEYNISYIKSSDGITWSQPVKICVKSDYNLCFGGYFPYGDIYAVSPNEIYFVARRTSDDQSVIVRTDYMSSNYAIMKRNNDVSPCTKNEQTSLGVAVANGLVAFAGKSSGYIYIAKPTGACYNVSQLPVKTGGRPALQYRDGKYTLIFRGYSTAVFYYYESIDGIIWNNLRTIPVLETIRGPYLMVDTSI